MAERNVIVRRVNALSIEQQKSANTNGVVTGVAPVLFWPAAFALAATKDNATTLSAAKGNYDAVTTQMRNKNRPLPPEALAPAATEA